MSWIIKLRLCSEWSVELASQEVSLSPDCNCIAKFGAFSRSEVTFLLNRAEPDSLCRETGRHISSRLPYGFITISVMLAIIRLRFLWHGCHRLAVRAGDAPPRRRNRAKLKSNGRLYKTLAASSGQLLLALLVAAARRCRSSPHLI